MPVFAGTVYWQAEDRDGILLMSAYCVYCCASPLFLSSVLMAHLNKALGVSNNTDSSPGAPLCLERGACGIMGAQQSRTALLFSRFSPTRRGGTQLQFNDYCTWPNNRSSPADNHTLPKILSSTTNTPVLAATKVKCLMFSQSDRLSLFRATDCYVFCYQIFHLERQDGCGRSYENVIQTFVRTAAVCVLPVIVCSAMTYFMVSSLKSLRLYYPC